MKMKTVLLTCTFVLQYTLPIHAINNEDKTNYFTKSSEKMQSNAELYAIANSAPRKMTLEDRFHMFVTTPIIAPITLALNGEANPITKTICQYSIYNFMFNYQNAQSFEERDTTIRNFVEQYEECKKIADFKIKR